MNQISGQQTPFKSYLEQPEERKSYDFMEAWQAIKARPYMQEYENRE